MGFDQHPVPIAEERTLEEPKPEVVRVGAEPHVISPFDGATRGTPFDGSPRSVALRVKRSFRSFLRTGVHARWRSTYALTVSDRGVSLICSAYLLRSAEQDANGSRGSADARVSYRRPPPKSGSDADRVAAA